MNYRDDQRLVKINNEIYLQSAVLVYIIRLLLIENRLFFDGPLFNVPDEIQSVNQQILDWFYPKGIRKIKLLDVKDRTFYRFEYITDPDLI